MSFHIVNIKSFASQLVGFHQMERLYIAFQDFLKMFLK